MRATTENTNTADQKETRKKNEPSQMDFFRLFGFSSEQQKLIEMERVQNEAASQRVLQNTQSLQREPEKWKQIQIESLDHNINFNCIDTSILHQHKWVVERRGFSTSIDVPKDKYDSIVEKLKFNQAIFKINGQWRQSWLYRGLENSFVRFPNTF